MAQPCRGLNSGRSDYRSDALPTELSSCNYYISSCLNGISPESLIPLQADLESYFHTLSYY